MLYLQKERHIDEQEIAEFKNRSTYIWSTDFLKCQCNQWEEESFFRNGAATIGYPKGKIK